MGTATLLGCLFGLLATAPAGAVTITEFPSDGGQLPRYIHVGPDQNLWYTEVGASAGAVGRISTSGERFSPIVDAHKPVDLVTMPDGTVDWTTDVDWLGRRLPNGTVQSGSVRGSGYAIATTASGDLRWTASDCGTVFTSYVWRFTSAWGGSKTCAPQLSDKYTRLTGLTLGADGRLWTAAYEANVLGRMNAGADAFDLTVDLPSGSGPSRLALGPDGNLWVTMYDASAIDRITPGGTRLPRFELAPGLGPNDIVEGPDGALWFTEFKGDAIGRITLGGQVQEFKLAAGSQPIGITAGPDDAIWFTESGTAKIGRLRLDPGQGGAGGGGRVVDRVAPRFLAGAAFKPKRFRVASGPTPVSARTRRSVPRGSALSYSLSEPAAVTIVIARPRTGRRVGRTCKKLTRSNRQRRHCTYYTSVGTLRRRALQGLNRVAFSGRIGRRALAPGTYRATVTAKDAAGNVSKPSVASFTIVR
jgi:streptogramin lyase